MKIVLTRQEMDTLIDGVMENYPEYSSPSIACVDWDYKACKYHFWDVEVTPETVEKTVIPPSIETLELRRGDVENAVTFHLDRKALRAGMENLLDRLGKGELPGISEYVMRDVTDAGNWDCWAADALVQASIFGDVIYG
jgi:hypothetical protein